MYAIITVSMHMNIFNVPIYVSSGHSSAVLSVAFSPDGNTIASGSEDSSIKIWNVSDLSDDVYHAIYGVYYVMLRPCLVYTK